MLCSVKPDFQSEGIHEVLCLHLYTCHTLNREPDVVPLHCTISVCHTQKGSIQFVSVFDSQIQIKSHHSNLTWEKASHRYSITVKPRHLFNSLVIEFLPRVSEPGSATGQLGKAPLNW